MLDFFICLSLEINSQKCFIWEKISSFIQKNILSNEQKNLCFNLSLEKIENISSQNLNQKTKFYFSIDKNLIKKDLENQIKIFWEDDFWNIWDFSSKFILIQNSSLASGLNLIWNSSLNSSSTWTNLNQIQIFWENEINKISYLENNSWVILDSFGSEISQNDLEKYLEKEDKKAPNPPTISKITAWEKIKWNSVSLSFFDKWDDLSWIEKYLFYINWKEFILNKSDLESPNFDISKISNYFDSSYPNQKDSYFISLNLNDWIYQIKLKSLDKAWNSSDFSNEISFEIDNKNNSLLNPISSNFPNQEKWYNEEEINLSWDKWEKDLDWYYYLLSNFDDIEPSYAFNFTKENNLKISWLINQFWELQKTPSGKYFFHIFSVDDLWNFSKKEIYKLNIDKEKPNSNITAEKLNEKNCKAKILNSSNSKEFIANLKDKNLDNLDCKNSQIYNLSFSMQDHPSQISSLNISINNQNFKEIQVKNLVKEKEDENLYSYNFILDPNFLNLQANLKENQKEISIKYFSKDLAGNIEETKEFKLNLQEKLYLVRKLTDWNNLEKWDLLCQWESLVDNPNQKSYEKVKEISYTNYLDCLRGLNLIIWDKSYYENDKNDKNDSSNFETKNIERFNLIQEQKYYFVKEIHSNKTLCQKWFYSKNNFYEILWWEYETKKDCEEQKENWNNYILALENLKLEKEKLEKLELEKLENNSNSIQISSINNSNSSNSLILDSSLDSSLDWNSNWNSNNSNSILDLENSNSSWNLVWNLDSSLTNLTWENLENSNNSLSQSWNLVSQNTDKSNESEEIRNEEKINEQIINNEYVSILQKTNLDNLEQNSNLNTQANSQTNNSQNVLENNNLENSSNSQNTNQSSNSNLNQNNNSNGNLNLENQSWNKSWNQTWNQILSSENLNQSSNTQNSNQTWLSQGQNNQNSNQVLVSQDWSSQTNQSQNNQSQNNESSQSNQTQILDQNTEDDKLYLVRKMADSPELKKWDLLCQLWKMTKTWNSFQKVSNTAYSNYLDCLKALNLIIWDKNYYQNNDFEIKNANRFNLIDEQKYYLSKEIVSQKVVCQKWFYSKNYFYEIISWPYQTKLECDSKK